MGRTYKVDIHPREGCPRGNTNCSDCVHLKYIGTLGGEYYIDCPFIE